MALKPKPKRDPRPVLVSVRLSERAVAVLKGMAKANNLSQADVLEQLIAAEAGRIERSKRRGTR